MVSFIVNNANGVTQIQNPMTYTNTIQNANVYDYIRAFALARASDPVIVDALVETYTMIAQGLGISPIQFVQRVQAQGNTFDQDLYLATYMNTVRAKNALIGVAGGRGTPYFVAREIQP